MPADLPFPVWSQQTVNSSERTTVGGLTANETYAISVLAFTSHGDGPLSASVRVKMQQGGSLFIIHDTFMRVLNRQKFLGTFCL